MTSSIKPGLTRLFCVVGLFSIILNANIVDAAVKGPCVNCHTMHNSQNNSSVALADNTTGKIGWNDSGQLDGVDGSTDAQQHLLVSDCVGCHSSTTNQTIIDLGGGSKIPIVYNMEVPVKPLAGGNFHWVGQGSDYDGYGHNVYGIADSDLDIEPSEGAPGNKYGCGQTNDCHHTLASPTNAHDKPGCQGCHYNVFHHSDNGQYRFLNGHMGDDYYVEGVEDGDWEKESDGTHNFYKGTVGPVSGTSTLASKKSISTYCGGCHYAFHRKQNEEEDNIGDVGAWLRHPTDIVLPNTSEYAGYQPQETGEYSTLAPVSWGDPNNPVRDQAIVMCLSCHRPHGSGNPDILRWNYDNCDAGTDNGACGCFVCHTTKDGD